MVLVHRKISEQPPFAAGKDVQVVGTELGKLLVLLCGDLFDDDVKSKPGDIQADFLLLPLARSFVWKIA